jgi:hypothetical protein
MIRTIIVFLFPIVAFAGGNPHNDEVDVDVGVNVGGDTVNVGGDTVNVGGASITNQVGLETGPTTVNAGDVALNSDSKSFAFAHGLGDVDIADCLGSEQWGTIIVSRQYLELNKWCAAEVYDAKGLYQMAAILRCDIKEVKKHFADPQDCIKANTVEPVIVGIEYKSEPEVIIVEPPQELQETHVEQQMALNTLEQKLAKLEKDNRATQKLIRERRQIAQETLEKLENDPED